MRSTGRKGSAGSLGREDRAAPSYTPGQEAAWKAAAAAWRQRNAPSPTEISRAAAAAVASAAASAAAKSMKTPAQRAAAAALGASAAASAKRPGPPQPPGPQASENEWRGYFRAKHHVRGRGLSFEALLALYCPATEESLRARYHAAVRRYHPDSNSPDRAWRSERQRLECEEIMKLINAQKPHSI